MYSSDNSPAIEPIAIVGMAMRFPGQTNSSDEFWNMISKGRSAHSAIPKERFNVDGYYHPDSARAGAINVKGGYFLAEDPRLFDAPFFSMTANEANGTDPQQRIMLEIAYEAFENAGVPMSDLTGSQTSVYVGCFTKDFESVQGRDPYSSHLYSATGTGMSMLSSRVSWFFDLRGPSMTIDTACSSSMSAVHLACQSLRLKESKMALIGGTNLIADPAFMRDLVSMKFLSPDGVCHSFDHRANGYARGDGIGGIVLKTLTQALEDGDTIRAIIRNSGLGQDGKTTGITTPSPEAHADLIRATYAAARLSLDQTAYFEAHGTGTAIGDPSELSALGMTFGKTRSPNNPVYVGSVKCNIGHLEGGAGLAGLMKAVLVVERGLIPPLAGFEKPNSRLKLDEWGVALPKTLTTWPIAGVRRASINSFGYGGANAHVVVDDAHHYLEHHDLTGNHQTTKYYTDSSSDSGVSFTISPAEEITNPVTANNKLFLFSSADQDGLTRLSSAYSDFLSSMQLGSIESSEYLHDLAYTLASRRTALDHTSFIISSSVLDLSTQLRDPIPKLRRVAKNNNIFFIFTGQGAQWPTMGRDLMHYGAFNGSLQTSQLELDSLGCSWSLTKEMFAGVEESRIDMPTFSQPLCAALQIALVDLLRTWGIKPKAVIGHSSGEIAAAYAAGAVTHRDAIKVAYFRGLYCEDIKNRLPDRPGAMISVGLSESGVQPYLSMVPANSVAVACINAPQSITLSGDESSIDQLSKLINDDGLFAKKLRIQVAGHSCHMEVISDDYLKSMGTLTRPEPQDDSVTMYSSVTAAPISAKEIDASYWVKNMISPVRFSEAVTALVTDVATKAATERKKQNAASSYAAAIEIGPAATLRGPLTQILNAIDERLTSSIIYTSMLSRKLNADMSALNAAGKLWARGLHIDIPAVNFPGRPNRKYKCLATLPPYSWNHSKAYGHESDWGRAYRHVEKPRTDLLGMRLPNQDPTEPRWHNWIRLSEQPWIADHKVQQKVMYPGAAMIVMAIEAACELVDPVCTFKAIETRDILFEKPLFIPGGDTEVETAMHLRPTLAALPQRTSYSFRMFSQAGKDGWQEHCTGTVSILYENDQEEGNVDKLAWKSDIKLYDLIQKRATKKISSHALYKLFDKKMNLQYGPHHQNVTQCIAGNGEGYGTITIPDTKSIMPSNFEYPHLIHPCTLDSILHMGALGYLSRLSGEECMVPISISSIYIAARVPRQPGSELKGYTKDIQNGSGDSVGDIVLSIDDWTSPMVVVRRIRTRDVSAENPDSVDRSMKCTSFEWINFIQKPQAPLAKLPELLILCGSVFSSAAQSLAHNLTNAAMSTSESAQVVYLHDVSSLDFRGQTVISLVEAETSAKAKWVKSDFDHFKSIMQQAEAVLWVTRGGDYSSKPELDFSLTTGLLRTIRVERPQLKLPHIDLSPEDDLAISSNVESILLAAQTSISNKGAVDQEFKIKGGKLIVPRLKKHNAFHAELSCYPIKDKPLETRIANISGHVGSFFDSNTKDFAWQHIPEILKELREEEIEIELSLVHLEQADLTEGIIGRDAVGTIRKVGSAVTDFSAGDVVVVCGFQTMRSIIRVQQSLVMHLPGSMDQSTATTLPSAVCAAHAVLVELARLQPQDAVLICSTPGSLENSLIHLAKQLTTDVFVLAQNCHHRNELIQRFGFDDDHILQSTANEPFPSRLRSGGFDIIATTLSGAVMDQSINCLRAWGRFISIGRQSLGTVAIPLARNITISNFDLEHMKTTASDRVGQLFQRSWARCLEHGFPPSTTFHAYPSSDIQSAIAYLQDEKSASSTVIPFSPNDTIAISPAKPPILTLDPKATYVLSGGLGGIGRAIAELMFDAGARNISFLSRSGVKSEQAKRVLSSLVERGCNAQAFQCDITDASQVQTFVESCQERGESIKGLVQCAMVLRDSTFENMTFEQWTECTQPKVQGSWNLHQAMPSDLDFFIMLSSMSGVIGNPGQANYAAGGTYQDALSQYRRGIGLVSTTLDLGIVSDVGYLAENPEQLERFDGLENLFTSERDLRIILETTMLGKTKHGYEVPAQLVTGVGKELMSKGLLGSAMCNDLKYTYLRDSVDGRDILAEESGAKTVQDRLEMASTVNEACAIVKGELAAQLSKPMNMESDDIDLEKPVHAFGVDSLAAVEIKNMIFRHMNANVSIFEILSTQPIAKLAVKIVSKSKFVKQEVAMAARDEVVE